MERYRRRAASSRRAQGRPRHDLRPQRHGLSARPVRLLAHRRHRRAGQRPLRRRARLLFRRPRAERRDLHPRHARAGARAPPRKCAVVRALVCMDGPQPGAESLPALLDAGFAAPPDPADEDAIAHLSYTSGTTGKPKGACLAHEPTMRAANCIAERLRISGDDVSFGPTALSSSYQLVGNLLPPLHRGATVNVMGRWTQETGFDALEQTQATMLVGNPTLLNEVLIEARGARPHAADGCASRVSGGGAGAADAQARVARRVAAAAGRELRPERARRLHGAGRSGARVRTRSSAPPAARCPTRRCASSMPTASNAPIGEVGEVCLRGGFMKGYWGKPEKTAEAMRGGWLHTGDVGVMDARRLHHHARPLRRTDQGRRPHLVSARRRGGAVRAGRRARKPRSSALPDARARPAPGRLRDAVGQRRPREL